MKIPHLLLALLLLASALIAPTAHAQSPTELVPTRTAIFAGGCFWCVEAAFDEVPGVTNVVSGYSGGRVVNPTYEQVSREDTGHAEVVQVSYDPRVVSYSKLLEIFWRNVDPFDAGGQFCDRGDSYRAEIFVGDERERVQAEASKARLEEIFSRSVATQISPAAPFYAAEDYHQDYHRNNPLRYRLYRSGCGRDARLREVWGAEAGAAKK